MLSQRLVGKLCPNCKKAEDPPQQILEIVKKELSKFPPDVRAKYKEPYQIYHALGCSVCHGRGIVGRIAIFEVLAMTRELADIISTGISEGKIFEEAKRQGMLTLRQDGILKALDGLVAIEEVLKETAE
jgi:type II secretory ATPase GspE/PulE/Tfp pilus assembly ATPase PilB-like protein